MELSPASAASEAFRAAEIIRIAAQKPKKEDYSDYEVFRQEYKSWHGQWTRCQQDPAKRQAERERDAARHAERSASRPRPAPAKPPAYKAAHYDATNTVAKQALAS